MTNLPPPQFCENVHAFFVVTAPLRPDPIPSWDYNQFFADWMLPNQPPIGPSD